MKLNKKGGHLLKFIEKIFALHIYYIFVHHYDILKITNMMAYHKSEIRKNRCHKNQNGRSKLFIVRVMILINVLAGFDCPAA